MRRGLLEIEARKKSIDINGCYDKDEPYWKIGGWFKIVCSIEMPSILDIKKQKQYSHLYLTNGIGIKGMFLPFLMLMM